MQWSVSFWQKHISWNWERAKDNNLWAISLMHYTYLLLSLARWSISSWLPRDAWVHERAWLLCSVPRLSGGSMSNTDFYGIAQRHDTPCRWGPATRLYGLRNYRNEAFSYTASWLFDLNEWQRTFAFLLFCVLTYIWSGLQLCVVLGIMLYTSRQCEAKIGFKICSCSRSVWH